MKNKLSFIFIFTFLISILRCSRHTTTTIKKAPTVTSSIVAKTLGAFSIPVFHNTTAIRPYSNSVTVLMCHSIT